MSNVDEVIIGGVAWVDVIAPTQAEMTSLGQRFGFSPLELEDCLSRRQLQKIEDHEGHLFVIIHYPRVLESDIVRSAQISIFLGDNYLVTVHQEALPQISEIFQWAKKDAKVGKVTSGFLLHRILDRLVDSMFPFMEGIMRELDAIEDKVFDERIEVVRELTTVRHNIAALRRTILPLRRITAALYDEIQMRTPKLAASFKDVNDHVEKVSAVLDEARETLEIYKDTDFIVSTERSNKILAILTIIFTLSIPGTMIGTFYGMNILLPGGIQSGAWTQLGPYTTLIIVLLASLAPTFIMVFRFHRLGWI
jgi:magnesium transporter